MIKVSEVVQHREHVIHWNDIDDAICKSMGFSHLRDRPTEGGPGFDFWLYFTERVTEYIPDGITEGEIYLLDHIDAIEENDFTIPHKDDQNALPILKTLASLIPEDALDEGFYVDFC